MRNNSHFSNTSFNEESLKCLSIIIRAYCTVECTHLKSERDSSRHLPPDARFKFRLPAL